MMAQLWAGEMAQCLRTFIALARDLDSVPSSHISQLAIVCTSSSRSDIFFWVSLAPPCLHGGPIILTPNCLINTLGCLFIYVYIITSSSFSFSSTCPSSICVSIITFVKLFLISFFQKHSVQDATLRTTEVAIGRDNSAKGVEKLPGHGKGIFELEEE